MNTPEEGSANTSRPFSRSTATMAAIALAAVVGACVVLLYMWLDLSADYNVITKDLLARGKTTATAVSEAHRLRDQVRRLEPIIKYQDKALREGRDLRGQQNASIRLLMQQTQDLRADIKTLKDEVRELQIKLSDYELEPSEAATRLAKFRVETAGIIEYLRTLSDTHKAEMQRAHKKIKELEQRLSEAQKVGR